MAAANGERRDALTFGPFTLAVSKRLLERDGHPVELGGRALDILIALVTTPNEVVTKQKLMSQVWPDSIVEEGSLRFHMNSLRKALGDGKDDARYITTVPGRGYCFVAPVTRTGSERGGAPAPAVHFSHANLPARPHRMVGRDDDVLELSASLTDRRIVTIVGPGGVGKTTVALAVAHHVAEAFGGSVLFVDFGMISDARLAATAVTSMLGVSVQSENPTPTLIQFLRDKRLLLILDTCEHIVDAIAPLAATIAETAPGVHILATSREALRIEGEHVYRLEALLCPPDVPALSASAIQQFPATQLFVERALAGGARLQINDTEAAIVSDICRKLDGVALAIELAARRVESHGLEQTAALIDQHLALLWRGSRTAPARQKTLQAMMDWSYELLSDVERAVLRRLAVFVGLFTLEAALEVIPSASLDRAAVFEAIDNLVEKSIVAVRPTGAMMRYRLLDTTRAYALELGADQDERTDLSRRHAAYYRRWLEQTGSEWSSLSTGAERAPHFAAINNVRAALEWCFSKSGDIAIGIGLAAAAAPVFRAMALFPECHRWSERALAALDDKARGGSDEMHLQASLGLSLMLMRGHDGAAIAALNRSHDIARSTGDHLNEIRLLGSLHFYHLRGGDFRACLRYAERARDIAAMVEDPPVTALAQTLMGVSLNFMGDLNGARVQLEAAIAAGRASPANRRTHFGFDHYSWAGNALIRNLWLQGYPEQAKSAIDRVFDEAVRTKHPMALAMVVNSISVLLWLGDLDAVENQLAWFITRAEADDFGPYLHLGHAFRAELAIRHGDVDAGIKVLQSRLEKLHAVGYELLTVRFNVELVSGFASIGRYENALKLTDEIGQLIQAQGYLSYLPELLRVKGGVLLSKPEQQHDDAEACFTQALELSRAQNALAWQLRTATDLASLWARNGRAKAARDLLRPILGQFTEGRDTADFKEAERVLG